MPKFFLNSLNQYKRCELVYAHTHSFVVSSSKEFIRVTNQENEEKLSLLPQECLIFD